MPNALHQHNFIPFADYLQGESDVEQRSEHVMVSQDEPLVRVFRRRASWELEAYRAGEVFWLESVGLDVSVERVYRRVRREVGLNTLAP